MQFTAFYLISLGFILILSFRPHLVECIYEIVYKIYSRNVKVKDIISRRLEGRWGVTIDMDRMETGYEDVDWILLAQDGIQCRCRLVRIIFPRIS
jgi:hypothetical protein